jgi:microcystin-dependent protein
MMVVLFTVLQVTAFAVPEYINYQARIFDATGMPMQGTYAISFAIFDATRDGTMVWGPFSCDGLPGEGHADPVVVWDGWFNVILGPKDQGGQLITWAFKPPDGRPRFVEITVDGEVISPRQQLLTAPYAARADYALHGVPPGTIVAFYGALAPEGWLLCDGSPIPPGVEYDTLRALIGGANTPDLRGRMILMADPSGTVLPNSSPGFPSSGGEETHVLSVAEMPSHGHSFDVNKEGWPDGGDIPAPSPAESYRYWNTLYTKFPTHYTVSVTQAGSNQPHNNMPPYMALNWIIKY